MVQNLQDLARMRWQLAVNPGTPADVLQELAMLKWPELMERIAENPNANVQTLAFLAQHEQASVRAAVAENANATSGVLSDLVRDESCDVRYSIAENANVPIVYLHVLLDDSNPYVSHRARMTILRITRSLMDDKSPTLLEPRKQQQHIRNVG